MGDWNDLVNVFNTTDNTVENILRLEEEKNVKDKAPKADWNELVSNAANMAYMKGLEEKMDLYQTAMKQVFSGHLQSHSRSLPLSLSSCQHPVLVEALSVVSSRALVYHGWFRLVQSEIVQGVTRADTTLHLTLYWFLLMYPRYNLNESILYGDRIQIFASFSTIAQPSLPHAIKELIRSCMNYQPMRDLIQVLLIDIDKWQNMKYPPNNLPQEPIVYEEIVRSMCACDFHDPDVEVEYRVHKALRDPATRTDTALALLSMVRYFLSSTHSVNDLQKKVGWCLSCVFSNIKPFPLPATNIPPVLKYIDSILSDFQAKLNPIAKDLMANLKQVLSYMFEQKMVQASFSEPRYDIELPKSTVSQKESKIAQQPTTADDTSVLMTRPNTARYHKEGYERINLNAAIIAHVEDVWVQVEYIAPTKKEGNFLTSATRGHLIFSAQQILWIPVSIDNSTEAGLAIKYDRVTHFTGGAMNAEGSGSNGGANGGERERKREDSSNQLKVDSVVVVSSPNSISGEQSYLSIHSHDSTPVVYYFFPFTNTEMNELQRMLQDLSGKSATNELKYGQIITDQKVSAQRIYLLQQLLQQNQRTVWISDMDTLTAVLRSLLSITKQRGDESYQFELERLFHSCRLNDEVAVETVTFFREMWESVPEAIHLKILAIIDRLLDRALMHVDSPAFWALSGWLDHVEKTLNPYKNSKTLEIIYELKNRVQMLKRRTLVPLSSVAL